MSQPQQIESSMSSLQIDPHSNTITSTTTNVITTTTNTSSSSTNNHPNLMTSQVTTKQDGESNRVLVNESNVITAENIDKILASPTTNQQINIQTIEMLKQQIQHLRYEQNAIIETNVIKALKHQQGQFNDFLRQNNAQIQNYYEQTVIPQKMTQWVQQEQSKQENHLQAENAQQLTNVSSSENEQEMLLSKKYEEWKQTYLPVILDLKYQEWLQEYEQHKLQEILDRKFQEWETVKLLSIMKQEKHRWILEELWKQNYQEIALRHQQEMESVSREFRTEIQRLQQQQQKQSQNDASYSVSTISESQEWKEMLRQQRESWQIELQREIQSKIHQVEQYWEQNIIPQRYQQWEQTMRLKIQQQQSQSSVNQRRLQSQSTQGTLLAEEKLQEIINAKYQEWKHTYLKEYLRIEKEKWLQEFKSGHEMQAIIQSKYEEWENVRLLSIVRESKHSWIVEMLLKEEKEKWRLSSDQEMEREREQWRIEKQRLVSQSSRSHTNEQFMIRERQIQDYWQETLMNERAQFERNIEEALQSRTQEVESHWVNVIVPQMRQEWEAGHSTQLQAERNRILALEEELKRLHEQLRQQQQQPQHHQRATFALESFQNDSTFIEFLRQREQQWSSRLESHWNERLQQQQRLTLSQKYQLQQQLTILRQQNANLKESSQPILVNNEEEMRHLHQQIHEQSIKIEQLQQQQELLRNANQNSYNNHEFELETKHLHELNQQKIAYEDQIATLNHEKNLLLMQIKDQEQRISSYSHYQSSSATDHSHYQKQIQSLSNTIANKQSQISFLKKSVQEIQTENNEALQKQNLLNMKIHNSEKELDEAKGSIIKFQYEVKYWKEKELSMAKKIDGKEAEISELKSRQEFEKNLLQKKIRELNINSQNVSALHIKISELESQVTIKSNNLRNLESELERRKRQTEELQRKHSNLLQSNEESKKSLSEQQQIIYEMKLESRRYNEEISRMRTMIETFEAKISISSHQQKHSQRTTNETLEVEALIRENQNLRQQLYRTKEKVVELESHESFTIRDLKKYIAELQQQYRQLTIKMEYSSCDKTEIEVLKRINTEVSDLMAVNKQLQMKILVLENQSELMAFANGANGTNGSNSGTYSSYSRNLKTTPNSNIMERFFIAFEQQCNNLIQYILSNDVLFSNQNFNGSSPQSNTRNGSGPSINDKEGHHEQYHKIKSRYERYQHKSRQALIHGYVEDYFRQWQAFMRELIEDNIIRALISKSSTRKEVTQNSKLNGHSSDRYEQSLQLQQNLEVVEKYDLLLNDVKFALNEYLRSGGHDQEYLQMMAKSLGLEVQIVMETDNQFTAQQQSQSRKENQPQQGSEQVQ